MRELSEIFKGSWRTHLMLKCHDCDWATEDYKKGIGEARQHTRETGHAIHGEEGRKIIMQRRDAIKTDGKE